MHDDDSKQSWQQQRREYDKILDQIKKSESLLDQINKLESPPRREIPSTFTGCLPILLALAMGWIGVLAIVCIIVWGPC